MSHASVYFQALPAMVIACIALFVGMSGDGYAATKIGSAQIKNNAVLSKHIENGQVRTGDLRANAVNGAKVADNTVAGEDVKDGTLSGVDMTNGSIANADLASNSVDSAKVSDDSLTGADVEGLTGADIDEQSLAQVPDAATVGGRVPSSFLSSTVYKARVDERPGSGARRRHVRPGDAFNAGDVLLSGGPASRETSRNGPAEPRVTGLASFKQRADRYLRSPCPPRATSST